jgi:hypothetical protein
MFTSPSWQNKLGMGVDLIVLGGITPYLGVLQTWAIRTAIPPNLKLLTQKIQKRDLGNPKFNKTYIGLFRKRRRIGGPNAVYFVVG